MYAPKAMANTHCIAVLPPCFNIKFVASSHLSQTGKMQVKETAINSKGSQFFLTKFSKSFI